jgi:lipoate-protein ligase A
MAVDEAILTSVSEGKAPPTVRFYGWQPVTLSVGYFQRAEEEVDVDELLRRGLGFVRRPTGGRAVLHDNELTYSVVVPESHPDMPGTVGAAYRLLSEGLMAGFRRLGLDARMASLADGRKTDPAAAGSAACFDSPSWYELVVEGRKAAGSAQLRHKGAILQHGSIPLELDADLLFAVLRFPDERLRLRMKASFADKATAVNDLLRRLGKPPVAADRAEEAFAAGFAEALGVQLMPGSLTEGERELAEALAREKYGNDAWNLRR